MNWEKDEKGENINLKISPKEIREENWWSVNGKQKWINRLLLFVFVRSLQGFSLENYLYFELTPHKSCRLMIGTVKNAIKMLHDEFWVSFDDRKRSLNNYHLKTIRNVPKYSNKHKICIRPQKKEKRDIPSVKCWPMTENVFQKLIKYKRFSATSSFVFSQTGIWFLKSTHCDVKFFNAWNQKTKCSGQIKIRFFQLVCFSKQTV